MNQINAATDTMFLKSRQHFPVLAGPRSHKSIRHLPGIGRGAYPGQIFTDSRGQRYVRDRKGTIRRA